MSSEYKKESELIIVKQEIFVKERYAFRITSKGKQQFLLSYPIPVKKVKGRDKFGELPVLLINSNEIKVSLTKQFQLGTVHAVELTLLIYKKFENIGGIQIIDWGSMNLFRIKSDIKPFQVLGFLKSSYQNNKWVYTDNLSKHINSNLARFRASRIELGNRLEIIVSLQFIIDSRQGGRIHEFNFFGPKQTKRQDVQILTSGVDVNSDKNGNPIYSLDLSNSFNQIIEREIHWKVVIPRGREISDDLGSMKALNILTRDNNKFRQLLEPGKYWEVDHPSIQKIAKTLATKPSIFANHRYLFEFTNRKLKYQITNNRQTAITSLISETGDCSEFADLLVTLHRAAGIPSRIVEGMILENSKKSNPEMHAWVQFLTTKGWIDCDPTWGITLGTTSQHIEFNHQQEADLSMAYNISFNGPRPKIKHKLSWR